MKEMYDIEMVEARKLIEDTRRDAQAATGKTQQAEIEVKRQKTRYTEVTGLRETDRKEIYAIERKIAENDAVRFNFTTNLGRNLSSNENDFS
jgi:hypothetical protein